MDDEIEHAGRPGQIEFTDHVALQMLVKRLIRWAAKREPEFWERERELFNLLAQSHESAADQNPEAAATYRQAERYIDDAISDVSPMPAAAEAN